MWNAVVMPTCGPKNASKHTSSTILLQKLLRNYFVFPPTSLTGALLLWSDVIDGCPPWRGGSPDKHLQTATCQFFLHPHLSGCPVSQRIHQRTPNTNVAVLLFLFHPTMSTSSTLGSAMPGTSALTLVCLHGHMGGALSFVSCI